MDDVDISDVIRAKDQLVQDLLPPIIDHGVLIPLKTTLEIRDDHVYGQALITRAPLRATSLVVKYVYIPVQTLHLHYTMLPYPTLSYYILT